MAIIVIDIGGTGARCAAAAMYALTSGLAESSGFARKFGTKINFLHIDKDEKNGTGRASETAIKNYRNMYIRMAGQKAKMPASYDVDWGFWKINEFRSNDANSNLREVFPNEEDLLNLLFADEDQTRRLDCGFEQRPALGAVYFARIQDSLEEKIADYMLNNTDDVAVFIFASAFGGCGASMFMHVAKFVREKFSGSNLFIGGAFMEPYFLIPPLKDSFEAKKVNGDFRLQTDDLIPATQKAFTYYGTMENLFASDSNYANTGEDEHYIFDALYPLGLYPLCNNIKKSGDLKEEDFHKGNDKQKSLYSLADLLAALAFCDFLGRATNGGDSPFKPEDGTHNLMNTKLKHIAKGASTYEISPLTWENLPNGTEVKRRLLAMVKFALYTMCYLFPEYYSALSSGDRRGVNNSELGKQFNRNQLSRSKEDQDTVEAVFTHSKQFIDFIRDIAATNAGNRNSQLTELLDVPGLDVLIKTLGDDMETAAKMKQELLDHTGRRFGLECSGLVFGTDKGIRVTDEHLAYIPELIRTAYTSNQRPGDAAEFFARVYDACLKLSTQTKEVA